MPILRSEIALKLAALRRDKVPPPQEITSLKERIKHETKVAELRSSVTGAVDMQHLREIVGMKLKLDQLYAQWAESQL